MLGRLASNQQPPVLETGALPVELRPIVREPPSDGRGVHASLASLTPYPLRDSNPHASGP